MKLDKGLVYRLAWAKFGHCALQEVDGIFSIVRWIKPDSFVDIDGVEARKEVEILLSSKSLDELYEKINAHISTVKINPAYHL
jgi:hypothetical protein